MAGCPHDEIGHPRGFVGTQIFAWTVTCLAWAPICCVWTPKAYCWAPIVMRWMSTCCCWVSIRTGRASTRIFVDPQICGWKATRILCAPITAPCGPPKNRQLSRIGSPHPSTKFHAQPQQPTRECCVVPRVLCASPRVLRACPPVSSVLCGGAYFCAWACMDAQRVYYVRPRNRATKNPLPKGERTFGARR